MVLYDIYIIICIYNHIYIIIYLYNHIIFMYSHIYIIIFIYICIIIHTYIYICIKTYVLCIFTAGHCPVSPGTPVRCRTPRTTRRRTASGTTAPRTTPRTTRRGTGASVMDVSPVMGRFNHETCGYTSFTSL